MSLAFIIPQPDGRELWDDCTEVEWFAKGGGAPGEQKAGHKYIRRVPVGEKDGRTIYRYFYSEASLAHRVREGERINLRGEGVLQVHEVKGNKARVSGPDGVEREIELADLHAAMFSAWKDRATGGAERIAKRWAQAQLGATSIPDGKGPQARALWARHKKELAEAKVDEHAARALMAWVVSREDWTGAAKTAVTDLVGKGAKDVALVAANLRGIARAAENIAAVDGAKTVQPAHVMEAAMARLPGKDPKADGFPEAWTGLKNQLAKENVRAEAALEALEATIASGAGGAPKALVAWVRGAVQMEAALEAERLSQAFPALRNDEDLAKSHEIAARFRAAVAAIAPPDRPDGRGSTGTVYIADADGFPQPRAIRYRVVEADQITASHLPSNGFKVNPAYPEGVQERVYHSDKAEQDKVRGNAQGFRPDLVHNTNPDAVNGAPLSTSDGIVLGGNSRTMTMQLMYAEGKGDKIKSHLAENAHQFGLTSDQVEGMKQPILVRELVDTSAATAGKPELKDLVRRANESFTQGMDPRAAQVALAQRVPDRAIEQLSASMGADQTLNAFLSAGKPAKEFVQTLQAAGVIDRRNRSQYVRKDGLLNQDGRTYVERLLVGKMVPDPELLGELPLDTMASLARSAPAILSAKAADPKHDITEDLRVALRTMVDMKYHGHKTLQEHLGQGRLKAGEAEILGEAPIAKNERAKVLHKIVTEHGGVNTMSRIFRKYAESAQHDSGGQVGLFGEGPSPVEQLRGAIARGSRDDMEKGYRPPLTVGIRYVIRVPTAPAELEAFMKAAEPPKGPFVGPRKGVWADPHHTIPWDPKKHGRDDTHKKVPKPPKHYRDSDGSVYRVTGRTVERQVDGGEFEAIDLDPQLVRELAAEFTPETV